MMVKVLSLQIKLGPEAARWSATDLRAGLEAELGLAQGDGVDLVLLPGFSGLLFSPTAELSSSRHPVEVGQDAWDSFLNTMGELAQRYQVFLGAGTLPVVEEGRVYHRAFLFSPEGELLGMQDQTHTSAWERSWGMTPGEKLEVFATPIGRLAFLVGSDVWYPEVGRILALQGADIVLAPVSRPLPYSFWSQGAGLWQQVQQNQFFALEAGLTGRLWGTELRGRGAVFAPCEMTPGESGFLALAPSDGDEIRAEVSRVYPEALTGLPLPLTAQARAEPSAASFARIAESPLPAAQPSLEFEPVMAELDLARRQQVVAEYPLLRLLNPSLYRRYFPAVYRSL